MNRRLPYLVVGLAAVALIIEVLAHQALIGPVSATSAFIVIAATVVVGSLRSKPWQGAPWFCWMSVLGLSTLSDHDLDLGDDAGIAFHSGIIVLQLVLLLGGQLLFLHHRIRRLTAAIALDWTMFSLVVTITAWTVLVDTNDTMAHDALFAIAMWLTIGFTTTTFALTRQSHSSTRALRYLAAAFGVMTLDLVLALVVVATGHVPAWHGVGKIVAMALLALASIELPARNVSVAREIVPPKNSGQAGKILLCVALFVSPSAAAYDYWVGDASLDAAWATMSVLLLISLVARTAIMINAQTTAERALVASLGKQAAIATLSRRAVERAGPLEMMEAALEQASHVLHSERYGIFELIPVSSSIILRAGSGWSGEAADELMFSAADDTAIARALREGSHVLSRDEVAALLGDEDDQNLLSGVAVVIEGRDHPFGVMTAFSTRSADFDSDDVAFLHALANVLASVLTQLSAEGELQHAQKLESVGRLAAGIAHEINTPIQFVGDNLRFLGQAIEALQETVDQTAELCKRSGVPDDVTTAAAEIFDNSDLEFFKTEAPEAARQALDGIERVTTIVRAMKSFSHPDGDEQAPADINQALLNTLTVARNEVKYVAEVNTRLGPIPPVTCWIGEINQVFLNLIVNAAHAVGDVMKNTGQMGRISLRTWREGPSVVIAIGDTGAGIPKELRQKIFEPFFTTKEVGKGTGQGLALARAVILQHEGQIRFDSDENGTIFCIRLPIDGRRGVDGAQPERSVLLSQPVIAG